MFALQKGKEKQASPRRTLISSGKGAEKRLAFKMPLFFFALRCRPNFPKDLVDPRSPGGEYRVFYSLVGEGSENFTLFVSLFLLKWAQWSQA